MNNVVYVDFTKKNEVEDTYIINPDLEGYLDSLRELGVEEDDIIETIEAINDVNVYLAADEVVQEFADGWLELEQFL